MTFNYLAPPDYWWMNNIDGVAAQKEEESMKECKLSDLVPDGWVIKEIKTLKAYDKEGHLLWELYDRGEEVNKEENGNKNTCSRQS